MGNKSVKHANVLMLGLDNSGKTTLLYRMKLNDVGAQFSETVGFNYELVQVQKLRLHIWDLAGKEELIPFWKLYYDNMSVSVFVFVVRVDETERLKEAAARYRFLSNEESMRQSLKLLVCNYDSNRYNPNESPSAEAISALFKCPVDGKHEKIIFLNALKGLGLDILYEAIDKYF
jgi:small GTP-binding protein